MPTLCDDINAFAATLNRVGNHHGFDAAEKAALQNVMAGFAARARRLERPGQEPPLSVSPYVQGVIDFLLMYRDAGVALDARKVRQLIFEMDMILNETVSLEASNATLRAHLNAADAQIEALRTPDILGDAQRRIAIREAGEKVIDLSSFLACEARGNI